MKNNFFYSFSLFFLFSIPFLSNHSSYALSPQDEKKLYSFIQDFLNTKKDPQKPFAKWADELLTLLKGDPKYTQFCSEFNRVKTRKNAKIIALTFIKLRNQVPLTIKNYLEQQGKDRLLSILEERLKR